MLRYLIYEGHSAKLSWALLPICGSLGTKGILYTLLTLVYSTRNLQYALFNVFMGGIYRHNAHYTFQLVMVVGVSLSNVTESNSKHPKVSCNLLVSIAHGTLSQMRSLQAQARWKT